MLRPAGECADPERSVGGGSGERSGSCRWPRAEVPGPRPRQISRGRRLLVLVPVDAPRPPSWGLGHPFAASQGRCHGAGRFGAGRVHSAASGSLRALTQLGLPEKPTQGCLQVSQWCERNTKRRLPFAARAPRPGPACPRCWHTPAQRPEGQGRLLMWGTRGRGHSGRATCHQPLGRERQPLRLTKAPSLCGPCFPGLVTFMPRQGRVLALG